MTEQNLQHFSSKTVKIPQKWCGIHPLTQIFFSYNKEKHVVPNNVAARLHCSHLNQCLNNITDRTTVIAAANYPQVNHEGQTQVAKVTKSSAIFSDVTSKNREINTSQCRSTVKDLGSDFRIVTGRNSVSKNGRFTITPFTDVSAAFVS